MNDEKLRMACDWLDSSDAIVIGAGAGMGVDSGLPDFRGNEGFWNEYPPFRHLGLSFVQLANPRWFIEDPRLAWGFYGHRMNLYRATEPHPGFQLLRKWAESRLAGWFVYTSNVDGQFQKAEFDPERIFECHGSCHRLQRLDTSKGIVWNADGTNVEVDTSTMRAVGELPCEPNTGAPARPNILMFEDGLWNTSIGDDQFSRYRSFLASVAGKKVVAIEFGAGTAVPSVRYNSENLAAKIGAKLIRVNVRESQVSHQNLGLSMGALEMMQKIGAP